MDCAFEYWPWLSPCCADHHPDPSAPANRPLVRASAAATVAMKYCTPKDFVKTAAQPSPAGVSASAHPVTAMTGTAPPAAGGRVRGRWRRAGPSIFGIAMSVTATSHRSRSKAANASSPETGRRHDHQRLILRRLAPDAASSRRSHVATRPTPCLPARKTPVLRSFLRGNRIDQSRFIVSSHHTALISTVHSSSLGEDVRPTAGRLEPCWHAPVSLRAHRAGTCGP